MCTIRKERRFDFVDFCTDELQIAIESLETRFPNQLPNKRSSYVINFDIFIQGYSLIGEATNARFLTEMKVLFFLDLDMQYNL